MPLPYLGNGKMSVNPGVFKSVRIVQRSNDKNVQIFTPSDQEVLSIAITSNGLPLRVAYTVDPDDNELLIIIPDIDYKADINGNIFEGSADGESIVQNIQGDSNQTIGSHTGGTLIGNITGDVII